MISNQSQFLVFVRSIETLEITKSLASLQDSVVERAILAENRKKYGVTNIQCTFSEMTLLDSNPVPSLFFRQTRLKKDVKN